MVTAVTLTRGGTSQVLTFPSGFIQKVATTVTNNPEKTEMPAGGPASNIGTDVGGSGKTLIITGQLLDSPTGSSMVTGTGAPSITTKEQLKYWIEALIDGNQIAHTWTSNLDTYSVQGVGSTSIEGVTMPALFTATKVYVDQFTYDDPEAQPENIPFTLNLWVAGL